MTCKDCKPKGYFEVTCTWCGETGNGEKMFFQNPEWYHGLCIAEMTEYNITFDYGGTGKMEKKN